MALREPVTLIGGPFDGAVVGVEWGTTLVCEGDPLPEDTVARYRPTRERGVYRFRELDQVVARLPLPEQATTTEEAGPCRTAT